MYVRDTPLPIPEMRSAPDIAERVTALIPTEVMLRQRQLDTCQSRRSGFS